MQPRHTTARPRAQRATTAKPSKAVTPAEKAAAIEQMGQALIEQAGVPALLDAIVTECESYEPAAKKLTPLDRLDQLQRQIERAIEDVQDDETGSAYRARLVTIAARAFAAIRQVDQWRTTREGA